MKAEINTADRSRGTPPAPAEPSPSNHPMSITLRLALTLTFLLPVAMVAQTPRDSIKPRFSVGSTQTIIGYTQFSLPDLDARVAAAGLPRIASSAITVGIGADVRRGRALAGAAFQSMITRDHRNDSYRTRLSGSYSLFDLGYAVVRARSTFIYPIVGVGATHMSINVKSRGDFSFDDGLDNPSREIHMTGVAPLGHYGMLVEQRFARGASEMAMTLRIGAIRTLGSPSWMAEDSRIDGGPKTIRGTYARLAFAKPIRTRRDAALPIAGTVVQSVIR